MSAYGPEYVIQAYYKYKPASFRALALLVDADGKDRMTQLYMANMLRACAMRPNFTPPGLHELMKKNKRKPTTREKGKKFVDNLIRAFRGGENL